MPHDVYAEKEKTLATREGWQHGKEWRCGGGCRAYHEKSGPRYPLVLEPSRDLHVDFRVMCGFPEGLANVRFPLPEQHFPPPEQYFAPPNRSPI